MPSLPQDDILKFALQFYRMYGENIDGTSKKLYVFRIFNILVLFTVLFFVAERCLKEEGIMLIKCLESGITIVHVSIKSFAWK